jgi:hypothetical protein
LHLLEEAAATAEENCPGHALQQVAHLDRNQFGAQDEHTPPRVFCRRVSARLARPQYRLQSALKIGGVGRGAFVQNHQIDGQSLHPPVLVGAEKLPDDFQMLDLIDAHQDDWQVTRDAMRPKRGLPLLVAFQDFGRWP